MDREKLLLDSGWMAGWLIVLAAWIIQNNTKKKALTKEEKTIWISCTAVFMLAVVSKFNVKVNCYNNKFLFTIKRPRRVDGEETNEFKLETLNVAKKKQTIEWNK